MKTQEVKSQEVNKMDELKKELDFLQLEERLEMVYVAAAAACCGGCGNGSCDNKLK
ncbi:hypothetical protein GXP67_26985 [Rhodocytophaga rosea]|uniref:Uncharacterized protein n=1 Tax=Rhodocytophaga rosea TaxID=2704465 RepID=A0A6C0GPR7_9BACT|nr:hypothetical protein [Rhodocytophaga rosea]QHT70031.1 hypothetical protein GXP67_26985 [Rhodocytophaga rosea]